jgi:hypothetical protein
LTGTLSTSRLFSFTRCVRPRQHARICFRRSLVVHPLLKAPFTVLQGGVEAICSV